MNTAPILAVEEVFTSYGLSQVLFGVSLDVAAGECVCLLGRNGVGKTTTMRSIIDRKSTRLNSSHIQKSRMPSSA